MPEVTTEQVRRLGLATRTPEGEALLAYLRRQRQASAEQCVNQDGTMLYRAQGAVRMLDTVLADLERYGKMAAE